MSQRVLNPIIGNATNNHYGVLINWIGVGWGLGFGIWDHRLERVSKS